MLVKALTSFVGKISMNVDEVREIVDKELAKDLIRAGYVIEIKATKNDLVAKPTKNDEEKVETTEEVEEKVTKNKKKKK